MIDAKTLTIPNIIPLIILGLFFMSVVSMMPSLSMLAVHLITGFIGFLIALLLYVIGPMGGGDVKLFGAIALWTTPMGLLTLSLYVSLAGFGFALVILIVAMGRQKLGSAKQASLKEAYKSAAKIRIPYGIPIVAGTLLYAFNIF